MRVQREKGTEKQYRLTCRSCAAVIAYRSVPQRTDGKLLYVNPAAVRETPPTQLEMQSRKQQKLEAAASCSNEADASRSAASIKPP